MGVLACWRWEQRTEGVASGCGPAARASGKAWPLVGGAGRRQGALPSKRLVAYPLSGLTNVCAIWHQRSATTEQCHCS